MFLSLLLDALIYQLLHSVQALPVSSDNVGPVSLPSKLNDAQTGLATAKKAAGKLNWVTGVCFQNYEKRSLHRN